jgi:antitoxin component YwqK of YwqJK toxin-antitoxin module
MQNIKLFIFSLFIVLCSAFAQAQVLEISEDTTDVEDISLISDVIPSIELNTKEKKKEDKIKKINLFGNKEKGEAQRGGFGANEKKTPSNEYLGYRTSRTFIRRLSGKNFLIERFQYINEAQAMPAYNDEVFYFNKKQRKIERAAKLDKENGALLHGHYKKTWNGEILEDGYFYLGVKHGRWEIFDKDTNLVDKFYYNKGLYEDTKITYHDKNQTKVDEIVQMHNGVREGIYKSFYPSGRPKEKGEYVDGQRVGKWYEYYDQTKYARKREVMHPNRARPFDEKFVSYITKEWDEKGKLIINVVK